MAKKKVKRPKLESFKDNIIPAAELEQEPLDISDILPADVLLDLDTEYEEVPEDIELKAYVGTITREISAEWEAIDSLNSLISTFTLERPEDTGVLDILKTIVNEKTAHVGMLNKAIGLIDKGAATLIELGIDTAEDIINNNNLTESKTLNEDREDSFSIYEVEKIIEEKDGSDSHNVYWKNYILNELEYAFDDESDEYFAIFNMFDNEDIYEYISNVVMSLYDYSVMWEDIGHTIRRAMEDSFPDWENNPKYKNVAIEIEDEEEDDEDREVLDEEVEDNEKLDIDKLFDYAANQDNTKIIIPIEVGQEIVYRIRNNLEELEYLKNNQGYVEEVDNPMDYLTILTQSEAKRLIIKVTSDIMEEGVVALPGEFWSEIDSRIDVLLNKELENMFIKNPPSRTMTALEVEGEEGEVLEEDFVSPNFNPKKLGRFIDDMDTLKNSYAIFFPDIVADVINTFIDEVNMEAEEDGELSYEHPEHFIMEMNQKEAEELVTYVSGRLTHEINLPDYVWDDITEVTRDLLREKLQDMFITNPPDRLIAKLSAEDIEDADEGDEELEED